jgi:thiol-disulfide isomerase/thioredoxin
MFRRLIATLCLSLALAACISQAEPMPARAAPEFAGIHRWINASPLTIAQLRGKVVLVEFWTYECGNCLNVVPHVNDWHRRYHDDGLVVVGVHTPEFEAERIDANVDAAVKRLGIEYAVAQDNDYRTWNAYDNRYWPVLYLVDRDGRVVYRHIGEGGYAETEARIRALLDAKPNA